MVKTTKGGKVMNPTDAYRKELRKKELKRNKKERKKVREVGILKKDPEVIKDQIQKLELMKADGALDKARKHKKRQLEDTLNLVMKKRKEYEDKIKEKGEASVMFSHLGPPRRLNSGDEEERVPHPKPEDSVYYHPTLNPTGAPPPGKPPMYKQSTGSLASSNESLDASASVGKTEQESNPLELSEKSPMDGPNAPSSILLPPPPPAPPAPPAPPVSPAASLRPLLPANHVMPCNDSDRVSSEEAASESFKGVPVPLPPPPPPPPSLPPPLLQPDMMIAQFPPPLPYMGHSPMMMPMMQRPPYGMPPMMVPPPMQHCPPPQMWHQPFVPSVPSYVHSAASTVVKRPLAQHNPELTSMVPASVRVRRETNTKPKGKSVTKPSVVCVSNAESVKNIDDSYSAFLEDMKALGALDR